MFARITIIALVCCSFVGRQASIGEEKQVVKTSLEGGADGKRNHGYGDCQWLYPKKAFAGRVQLPEFKSKKPIYYEAKYGDSKDHTFLFVLDESLGMGSGYDTAYLRMMVNKKKFKKVTIKPDGISKLAFADRFLFRITLTYKKGQKQAGVAHAITDPQGNRYYASSSGHETTKGFAVMNEQGQILTFREIPGSSPGLWEIPKHYDGLYRLRPTIDLADIKYEAIDTVVRVEKGKIIEVVEAQAAEALLPLVYGELRKLAALCAFA